MSRRKRKTGCLIPVIIIAAGAFILFRPSASEQNEPKVPEHDIQVQIDSAEDSPEEDVNKSPVDGVNIGIDANSTPASDSNSLPTGGEGGDGTSPEGDIPDGLDEDLTKLYNKVPEARDFVLGCLESQSTPRAEDIDLTDLDLKSVPALYQWDERWGYAEYAGGLLGLTGCGPTCLSMAAIYLTGDTSLNPLYVADYATKHGHYFPGSGTAWTLFSEGAEGLGLKSRELPLSKSSIDGSLSSGALVALVLGPGDFTDSGHFILLTGIGEDGYTILDPNSPSNSERTWSYDTLSGQIKNIWSLTAK